MHIVIAGGHGQIALRLIRRLAGGGHRVDALVRNPDHAGDIEAAGGQVVLCDLEHAMTEDVASCTGTADVVVFAAGSGPGAGAERKWSMDRDGAVTLLLASPKARYLMVSAVGAEDPPDDDEVFSVYLRAKAQADEAVIGSGSAYVIVRPGPLSNDEGSGTVRVSREPFRAEISRDDVAAILEALIADPTLSPDRVVYAGGGDQPVVDALRALS